MTNVIIASPTSGKESEEDELRVSVGKNDTEDEPTDTERAAEMEDVNVVETEPLPTNVIVRVAVEV